MILPVKFKYRPRVKQMADNREKQLVLLSCENKTWIQVALVVKNLPALQETWVQFLGWEDLLEKEIATHSSILPWEIPWTEEPGGLQSKWSQRVRHN